MRLLACIIAIFALATPVFAEKASAIFRNGEKQEKAGHIVEAYLLYAQAAALDPGNRVYRAKTAALQSTAQQLQVKAAAPAPEPEPGPDTAPAPDPDSGYSGVVDYELDKARRALPPARLKLSGGRFDFHFSGEARDLFDQIATRCGLQTVFDGEYDQTPLKVRFDLNDADCRESLHAAEAATNSFVAPVSSKLILVSKDTLPKRAANEQTMSLVIPVSSAITAQDLTEISQAVKQATSIEKLGWNAATHEIVIRDRVSRVIPAKALVEQLVANRGSVLVELRFLQLSDSDILSYGVNLTNTFKVVWEGVSNPTLSTILRALLQGRNFSINAINASVVANLTNSTSRTILQTQMRGISGMPSTFHVGEKYPVLSSGYFGGTATTTPGTSYTPPSSFTYYDLGVSVKITPIVSNDLVTMDVESEYQLLAGQAVNGIPVLASRKFASRIAIHKDEWALIGGLTEDTDTRSVSGVAGLARIPLFGWLFKTRNTEKDRGHIVILMKPYLMGEAPGSDPSPAMRMGTETRPLSPI